MNPSVRRREYQSRHDRWTDPRRDFVTTFRDLGRRAFRTVLAVFAHLQTRASRLVRAPSFRDKLNATSFRIKLNAISLRIKLNAISFRIKLIAISFRNKLNAISFRDKLNAISFRDKFNAISFRDKLSAISFRDKFNAIRFRDKLDTISFRDKPNAIAERLRSRTGARAVRAPDTSRARGLSRDDDVLRLAGRTERQSFADIFRARVFHIVSQVVSTVTDWVKGHLEWAALAISMLGGIAVIIALNGASNLQSSTADSKLLSNAAAPTASSGQQSTGVKDQPETVAYTGSSPVGISKEPLKQAQISTPTDSSGSVFANPQAFVPLSSSAVVNNEEPLKQEQASAPTKIASSFLTEVQATAPKEVHPVGLKVQKSALTHRDASAEVLTQTIGDVPNLKQNFIACRNSQRDNDPHKYDGNGPTNECGVSLPAGMKIIVADTHVDKGICVRFLDDTVCYWPTGDLSKRSKPAQPTPKQSQQVTTNAPKAAVGQRAEDDQLSFLFAREKTVLPTAGK